jgi:uncharacterized protein YecT (DUF1311 family)
MRHLVTLLISLLLPSLASAAECRDEPGNVDTECFQAQWDREIKNADKELNAVYKNLLKSIDDENTKADLIKAQRAWLTFYQLDCKARYDLMHIGSSFTKWEVGESCRLDKLKRRITELKDHCGSDLNCRGR